MADPIFMTRERVDALHRLSLEQHGGQDGLRNEHGLESALAQTMNVFAYGQGDLFDLAAAYAYHIAENQPFIDGNKRTAITTALFFLEENGVNTSAITNAEHLRRHDRHRGKAHRQGRFGCRLTPRLGGLKSIGGHRPSLQRFRVFGVFRGDPASAFQLCAFAPSRETIRP